MQDARRQLGKSIRGRATVDITASIFLLHRYIHSRVWTALVSSIHCKPVRNLAKTDCLTPAVRSILSSEAWNSLSMFSLVATHGDQTTKRTRYSSFVLPNICSRCSPMFIATICITRFRNSGARAMRRGALVRCILSNLLVQIKYARSGCIISHRSW